MPGLRSSLDRFFGRGEYALTIPSLDGAFNPNDALDAAMILVTCPQPDNLVLLEDRVYFSSGSKIMRLLLEGGAELVEDGAGEVTSMASHGSLLAVARAGEAIRVVDTAAPSGSGTTLPASAGDVTALAFLDGETLVAAIGSREHSVAQWQRDLLGKGRSGSVWVYPLAGTARQIAGDLAYPSGLVPLPDGSMLVSLAWDSSLIRLDLSGARMVVLADLPAYPGRLAPAGNTGYWLALLAPRNQLVELILREGEFRRRMLEEIDPDLWVCPRLHPSALPLESMQNGGQRIGGVLKPWAPSLSCGLVLRLRGDLQPDISLHSRANGRFHGITSIAERHGRLVAASRGGSALIEVSSLETLR